MGVIGGESFEVLKISLNQDGFAIRSRHNDVRTRSLPLINDLAMLSEIVSKTSGCRRKIIWEDAYSPSISTSLLFEFEFNSKKQCILVDLSTKTVKFTRDNGAVFKTPQEVTNYFDSLKATNQAPPREKAFTNGPGAGGKPDVKRSPAMMLR